MSKDVSKKVFDPLVLTFVSKVTVLLTFFMVSLPVILILSDETEVTDVDSNFMLG
jgi:hypothetical protein